ncbi:MAG: OmpA family protein [Lachnospiraceae bacterium]|nr:OmpA family protein [Lachnospiraceae bacterium]
MRTRVKWVSFLACFWLIGILMLAGCGKSDTDTKPDQANVQNETTTKGLDLFDHASSVKLPEGDSFSEVTEELLFGVYSNADSYQKNYDAVAGSIHFTNELEHSVEPIYLEAGHLSGGWITCNHGAIEPDREALMEEFATEYGDNAFEYVERYYALLNENYMRVQYADRDGSNWNATDVFVYEVQGDQLLLKPLEGIDEKNFTLQIGSQETWKEIPYALSGDNLYLAWDGYEVVLCNNNQLNLEEKASTQLQVGYPADINHTVSGIGYISLYIEPNGGENDLGTVTFVDGSFADFHASYTGENEVTISWEASDKDYHRGKLAAQSGSVSAKYYLPAWGGSAGLILVVGDEPFYYLATWDEYEAMLLGDNLGDDVDLQYASSNEIEELVDQKTEVTQALRSAFSLSGISANVDEHSGKVTMDTNFLFAFDSSELSEEGQKYLDDFMDAYASVIVEKAKDGTVARILVEGHTDTNGSYDYNMTLSQMRADSVVDYCLARHPELASYFQAKGCSFNRPIFQRDGSVDADASRRVEFKFLLDV